MGRNLDDFIEACKAFGLKITPQRIAIYEEVLKATDHPSAEGIYRILKPSHPNLSFDTVNRTLLTFAEMGLIQIVEGSGDVRRFDPNIEQHHHLRCLGCGSITDFYDRTLDHLKIPKAIRETFSVKKVRVVIEGTCHRCRRITCQ
ncbi:MAG: transcriptional repressor [Desulfobacterota bacterium]|nr:transcriptional repressor [Thermodesulfobacteriota bacterium]